jgi:UPF0042 nucleotide-binding protein
MRAMADILVITGLSGAGRSQAADALEDLGWFVIDNLPTELMEKVAELANVPGSKIERLALVVGTGPHTEDIAAVIGRLRSGGNALRMLFLDASDGVLVQRYGSTRRRHPLARDGDAGTLDAIVRERAAVQQLKHEADLVVDTTGLSIHQLKGRLVEAFAPEQAAEGPQVSFLSFGYKHGLPLDADMVLDCRFLPNPYWVEQLRERTGLEAEVRRYVMQQETTDAFLERTTALLDVLLPAYSAEGRAFFTVAVGCTGGRHRSVVIAEELTRRLRQRGLLPRVAHRDLARP